MANKLDRYTDRAREALVRAQGEAQRLNHNYLGTEHLLLGLLRVRDGVAARVLRDQGVRLTDARKAVEAIIGRGERAGSGEIPLTPRTKKVMQLAADEARRLNHHYIGTEHLLLGLLREGEGIAAEVLKRTGVELSRLHSAVRDSIGANDGPQRRWRPRVLSRPQPIPSAARGLTRAARRVARSVRRRS